MSKKHFYRIDDIDLFALMDYATKLKDAPFSDSSCQRKTIVNIFLNPSLRTRLSTEKAAYHLGMHVMSLSPDDAWKWETKIGTEMSLDKAEHIKDAARVLSQYADIIAIRSFPELKDREADRADEILSSFMEYATVPILNLESASGHPLQALADAITIQQFNKMKRPRILLTWAPHPKALPHAVPISFARMTNNLDADFVIAHPQGYELPDSDTQYAEVLYDQDKALQGVDFVYVKNWSSTKEYGTILCQDSSWRIDQEKMKRTNEAYLMHCLPVRRNVVISDEVLDSERAICVHQANNRTYAAQAVMSHLLSNSGHE